MGDPSLLQDISLSRFNALAGYCRHPETLFHADEVRHLQTQRADVLVVVVRDHVDGDSAAILLARDLMQRYRWIDMTGFSAKPNQALSAAESKVKAALLDLETARRQGDEGKAPIDFFVPIVAPEKQHPDFGRLHTLEGYSPAKEIIEPMMRWYEDPDGNFIEQFQSTGFDARMWELYLFATLVEAGYALDRAHAVPDFTAHGPLGEICIEATTVNPTRDKKGEVVPPPVANSAQEIQDLLREYLPIKFAGPLVAKLHKRYWERENVKDRPLLLAIQDYHAPMSMTESRSALPVYLYGYVHEFAHASDGTLSITPRKVESHKWGSKEVPSGFFDLPGAEHISAVLANSSATISKFNRMGMIGGFGSKRVKMIRHGAAVSLDPNASMPRPFVADVGAPDYQESWMEGMDVYHNPRALCPLSKEMLPGAAHHFLQEDGQLHSLVPTWQPLSSVTQIFAPEPEEDGASLG